MRITPERARGLFERFESFEQKFERAKMLRERHHAPRRILVDSLDGDVHRQYAGVPNQCWVVDRTGRIAYTASWTTASEIRWALDATLALSEVKREGGNIYYREFFSHTQFTRTPEQNLKLARAVTPTRSPSSRWRSRGRTPERRRRRAPLVSS